MNHFNIILVSMLGIYLLACIVCDMLMYRIPRILHYIYFFSMTALIITNNISEYPKFLLGMLVAFLIMFPLYMIKGIGAGDVKMMSMACGYLGVKQAVVCIVLSIFVGGIISVIKLIYIFGIKKSSDWRCYYNLEYMKNAKKISDISKEHRIHFSIAIAAATAACVIGGV